MPSEIIKWGFYIYLGIIPLIPDEINSKYRIIDIYLVLLLFSYLVSMIMKSDGREKLVSDIKKFFKDYIIISMIVVIAIMGISTIYATDKVMSIQETIRFGTYICFLYYFINEIDIRVEINRMITFIYCPAFIVSVLGIIQYYTKIGIKVNTNGVLRIESTLGHPNNLGIYLTLLVFPLITIIFLEKSRTRKIVYSLLLVLMVFNIAVCLSRNSWLALAIGIVLLALVYNWKLLYGLIVAGMGILLTPVLRSRLMYMGMAVFNDGRIKHWAIALEMFKDKKLIGVGNGNYVTLHAKYLEKFPQYIVPGEENYPTHNSYLKVLSELGILGFIPFIILHTLIFLRGIKVCRLYSGKYSGVIKALIVSLLIFFQANLLDNIWFVPKVSFLYWIIVGIIIVLYRNKEEYESM